MTHDRGDPSDARRRTVGSGSRRPADAGGGPPRPTAPGSDTAISHTSARIESPEEQPASGRVAGTSRLWFRRAWPVLRYFVGILFLLLVVWVLSSHTDELSGLSNLYSHFHWWWLFPAVVVEAGSFVAFAQVQYELLQAGGVRAPQMPLLGVTVASQAIANSVPAGTAVALVYGFRWYRRFGADDSLAGWALVGTVVTAAVTLSLVAAAGIAMATSYGASLDLIPAVIGVLVVALIIGAMFVYERPLAVAVGWSLGVVKRLTDRPRGDLITNVTRTVERVTSVRLGWRQVLTVVGWGLANWILDCACFAFSFLAVGAGVPWKGLLLAYGAGQLAANLPITPGGLGVVEGSITIALVAFGGPENTTVEAVLVYRLISFWGELVVGWLSAGLLTLGVRNGRWPRRPLTRRFAGPGAPDPRLAGGAAVSETEEVGA